MRDLPFMESARSWKKGLNTVHATQTLAKGGHQKEDRRYSDRVSPPPNSQPQPVPQDSLYGYGQSASYYSGHPHGGPSSPFASNIAYPPSQSPPTVNYATGQSAAYSTQQMQQYNPQVFQQPGQTSASTGGYLPYSEQNQQNGSCGAEGFYNRNSGVAVYPHAQSDYPPDPTTSAPILHRNHTTEYNASYEQYGYEMRQEPPPRRFTVPIIDHDCAFERNAYTGKCGKCGAFLG